MPQPDLLDGPSQESQVSDLNHRNQNHHGRHAAEGSQSVIATGQHGRSLAVLRGRGAVGCHMAAACRVARPLPVAGKDPTASQPLAAVCEVQVAWVVLENH
eukprot:TRINITY_DN8129_c0_g1_i1.p2 TRINITY_DN8129_c0_g1~~TRINITY_DN8129_c0_g1_i1.p2  ORF type:complete len:101 (-),score=2.16 TRINITY_DN8129_c0_g1_i1:47-349(-)